MDPRRLTPLSALLLGLLASCTGEIGQSSGDPGSAGTTGGMGTGGANPTGSGGAGAGAATTLGLVLDGAPLGLGPHAEGSIFDTGPSCVYISLDEVDSMHDRAVAGGAEILMPPTDQDYGSRDFVAKDHEGNVWCFGTFAPTA